MAGPSPSSPPPPRARGARRVGLALLALLGVLGLLAPWVLLRRLSDAPRPSSIAAAPAYQDPALLKRAWSLEVAAAYRAAFTPQRNGSTCGPASLANLRRSLGEVGATERSVLSGTGRCPLGFCLGGLTLDELAQVAGHGGAAVTVLRDLTPEALRSHLRRANDLGSGRRYLVNFDRAPLFGEGGGHHSPIGGYLQDLDLVFVLDTNPRFGPWLVPAGRLLQAIDTVDPQSGRKRGLLVIEREEKKKEGGRSGAQERR